MHGCIFISVIRIFFRSFIVTFSYIPYRTKAMLEKSLWFLRIFDWLQKFSWGICSLALAFLALAEAKTAKAFLIFR